MLKTTLAAAAVALSVTLPAAAQTLPETPQPWWEKGVRSDLSDEQVKSACRLSAAGIYPNLLDAWDNEMRSRMYQNCLSWQQVPRQASHTAASPPVVEDCHFGECYREYIVSLSKDEKPGVLVVQTRRHWDCSGAMHECDPALPRKVSYKVQCRAPGFIESGAIRLEC
jgi:hypothetical protein